MRSLDHFRRWGVADDVRRVSPTPADLPTDIIFSTRLFGHHIATVPNIYFRGNSSQHDPRFPEPSEWIPQYLVERVLKAKLDTLPNVSFAFGCAFVDAEQTDDCVIVNLTGSDDGQRQIASRFLIGCDGARSRVRDAIGARMEGRHAIASHYNIVLRIPELNAAPPSPRGIMHWLINPEAPSVMGPMGEYWTLGIALPEDAPEPDREQIGAMLATAAGRPLDFEVLTTDRWYAHQLVATHYRDRRIFLAGDACHLHPPFGGYGMNMGIADAVDLGWKLHAVLNGWGGEPLLASYEWERRRVHEWIIEEAIDNYRYLSHDFIREGIEADDAAGEATRAAVAPDIVKAKQPEFHTIGLVLGSHYRGSPVVVGDPHDGTRPATMEFEPSTIPGSLAPHVWLAPGVSLYDRFGTELTLLDTGGDQFSREALIAAARATGTPLSLLEVSDDPVVMLYGASLFLIRPDEHIAWRGALADDAEARAILARITGRHPPSQGADQPN